MPISVDSVLTAITLFAAPFLRLSAMMVVAPVFSAAGFNVRMRALFAVLIAALVAPSLSCATDRFPVVRRGCSDGTAGDWCRSDFGFRHADGIWSGRFRGTGNFDDDGAGLLWRLTLKTGQVPVLSQLYVFGHAFVPCLDGHLMLIAAVVESYQLIPAGIAGIPVTSLSSVVALGTVVFAGGILLALPALTALLLINVAFGIVTRTAPQLNIFAFVGFPVTILAGLLIMFIVMPGFINALSGSDRLCLTRGMGALS